MSENWRRTEKIQSCNVSQEAIKSKATGIRKESNLINQKEGVKDMEIAC